MPRWSTVEVGALRRLKGVRLDGLRSFNLIVGPNNSGKTTVLEAIRLLGSPLDVWNWANTARSREIKSGRAGRLETLRYLFPQTQALGSGELFEGRAEFSGTGAPGDLAVKAHFREIRYEPAENAPLAVDESSDLFRRGLVRVDTVSAGVERFVEYVIDPRKDFEPPDPPDIPRPTETRFISPVDHRVDHGTLRTISDLLERRMKGILIQQLNKIDPTIEDIAVVVRDGRGPEIRVIRAESGGVPLSSEGDGIRRSLMLAAEAFAIVLDNPVTPGVLLVDEIETALHPTAMEKALQLLRVAAGFGGGGAGGIQMFATTHSLEVLDAVARVWEPSPMAPGVGQGPDDVAFYRLPGAGSGGQVVRYSMAEYRERRDEAGVDLR